MLKKNNLSIIYSYIFIFANAMIAILIILFTSDSINKIYLSRNVFPNMEYTSNELKSKLNKEFEKYNYEEVQYVRFEVYDEDFNLLRFVPLHRASYDDSTITKQIRENKELQKIFNEHQAGHTIYRINKSDEIDFYFTWGLDTRGQKILTIFYDIRESKFLVEYVPYLCYIMLFINFLYFNRNLLYMIGKRA